MKEPFSTSSYAATRIPQCKAGTLPSDSKREYLKGLRGEDISRLRQAQNHYFDAARAFEKAQATTPIPLSMRRHDKTPATESEDGNHRKDFTPAALRQAQESMTEAEKAMEETYRALELSAIVEADKSVIRNAPDKAEEKPQGRRK